MRFRHSIGLLLLGIGVLAAGWAWLSRPGSAVTRPPASHDAGALDSCGFALCTEAWNLTQRARGYGVVTFDYDQDGRLDLFVSNHNQPPALLRNEGDGFRDLYRQRFPPPYKGYDRHGASWVDVDDDGLLELYWAVGNVRQTRSNPSQLYHQDSTGRTYIDLGEELGIDDPQGRGRNGAFDDFDRDGDLDLLAANHTRPLRLFVCGPDGRFEDRAAALGLGGLRASLAHWTFLDPDGLPDVALLAPGEDSSRATVLRLFRQQPAGGFVPMKDVPRVPHATSMAWCDVDNDGDLDVLLTRSTGRPKEPGLVTTAGRLRLLASQEAGPDQVSFRASGPIRVLARVDGQAAGIQVGARAVSQKPEPTGDDGWNAVELHASQAHGRPALLDQEIGAAAYVWRDPQQGLWHVAWKSGRSPEPHQMVLIEVRARDLELVAGGRLQPPRDGALPLVLLRNEGQRMVIAELGLEQRCTGQQAVWGDFDNDGFQDLFVVTHSDEVRMREPNLLFHNRAGQRFEEVASQLGVASPEGRGASAAWGDLDSDGDLELYVLRGWGAAYPGKPVEPSRCFENQLSGPVHWLEIDLDASRSPGRGIGARVRVTTPAGTQLQLYGAASGSMQAAARLHFGLGTTNRVAQLRVDWPSGAVSQLTDVAADRVVVVREP